MGLGTTLPPLSQICPENHLGIHTLKCTGSPTAMGETQIHLVRNPRSSILSGIHVLISQLDRLGWLSLRKLHSKIHLVR